LTAWIIPIGAAFLDHWSIARDHGAWDLTRRAAIEPSDDIIFWLGGASVLAWVRATSYATSPIPRRPVIPWEDRETSRYVARFTFTTISEDPVGAPSWGQVRENIEAQSGLNRGPVRVDGTKGIHYLRSLFRAQPERALPAAGRQLRSVDTPGTDLARSLVAIDTEYEHSDTDARRRVLSAVVRRRGQQEFRGRLLAAYGGGCAVTGSSAAPVLEAAHIDAYSGDHTQHVRNGIVLRSDVHTLFDLHLITATAGFLVAVAPELRGTEYGRYHQQRLRLPSDSAQHPDADALARHRQRCTWYALAERHR